MSCPATGKKSHCSAVWKHKPPLRMRRFSAVGEAISLPKRTQESGSLNGISYRYLPLASPGGVAERSESFKIMIASGNHSKIKKLPDLTALRNRQGWLMRGGDRLVNECSWMSGICSGFLHSTEKSETFGYRCPSSVTTKYRFRNADISS